MYWLAHKKLSILSTAFLVILFAIVLSACEPASDLSIINRTNQVLRITFNETVIGEIASGAEIRTSYLIGHHYSYVDVSNNKGEIVYSKKFTGREIAEMKGRIIIAPEQALIGGPNILMISNRDAFYPAITVNGHLVGKIKSWKKLSIGYESGQVKYLIEIKEVNGKILHLHEYTGDELLKIGGEIIVNKSNE